jgi:hypothetical protein
VEFGGPPACIHRPVQSGRPVPSQSQTRRTPIPTRQGPCMAWTHILRCSDGSYYVGSTTHLAARASSNISKAGEGRTQLVDVRSSWCGVRSLLAKTRRTNSRRTGSRDRRALRRPACTGPDVQEPFARSRSRMTCHMLIGRSSSTGSRQARPPKLPTGLDKLDHRARPSRSSACRKFTDTTGGVHEPGAPVRYCADQIRSP